MASPRIPPRNLIRIATAAIFLLTLTVYFLTLCPTVDFIDAGELAAVTHTLGIPHPTGYPTFTMIGWLWSRLPLGDEIYRLNLLSAVTCAAGAAVYFRLMYFILGLLPVSQPTGSKGKKKGERASTQSISTEERVAVAIFGALVIAFSETYWSTALSIEVYSLHCLLLSLVLFFFAKALFEHQAGASFFGRERYWLAFAFTLGLSFTNHLTTILLAPACLFIFFRSYRFGNVAWKKIAVAAPAFFVGLLPYLYLPIAASAKPSFNWGNPIDLTRFIWHTSGKQYRTWIFSSTEAAGKQFKFFVNTLPAEFGYIAFVLMLVGVYFLFKHHRVIGWFVVILFATCVGYSINYDIHDIESYFLLAYITGGVLAAFGFLAVVRRFRDKLNIAFGIGIVSVGIMIGALWNDVSERENYLVEDYTMNMFRSLAPNALVISYQWDYFVSASYYYQTVKGMRRDVVVLDKELFRRSWYFEQLKKNHPTLYQRSKPEIDDFLTELKKFEHELPYDAAVIEAKYQALINSFVTKNIADRPAYCTIEIEKEFFPGYYRIPEGLALRLYAKLPEAPAEVNDNFTVRPFLRSERLVVGILGMYSAMLAARGNYLMDFKRYEDAARHFERALQFNPRDADAAQGLERARSALSGRT